MNVKKFTPVSITKRRNLNVGDVFFGEDEFIIGRKRDSKIEVGVTREQLNMITEVIVSKNRKFTVPKKDTSKIDKTRKNAAWVVEKVDFRESVKLIHSTLPASTLITARRLIENEITEDSETIEFYTSGIYENTISKEFEIIGTYK